MGGFFGITSKNECLEDVFFGTDYHSHLGTKRGGLAALDSESGLQRKIHSIENAPFRTKFEHIFEEMRGTAAIGCISDTDPQPLLIRSNLGTYAICMVGVINNSEELIDRYLSFSGGHFGAMSGGRINQTELLAALINQKSNFTEGIRFAQKSIEGTASILILKDDGSLIAARDLMGRLPISIGRSDSAYACSFESFAYMKLGFEEIRELGPGEIVQLFPDSLVQLSAPLAKKRICAFLWSYYGYPTSTYEGINVEEMRYRNGAAMAAQDMAAAAGSDSSDTSDGAGAAAPSIDYVGGVPDSGTPHAIGYANKSGIPFARAFIKYTPTWARSFMPGSQVDRDRIAKMKQIPVRELIRDKNLLFVDDSIVRGTQLKETVDFLYENGASSVHMRSACPPIMYSCKYLNFSRATGDNELLARRVIAELEGDEGFKHLDEYADGSTERGKKLRSRICEMFHFSTLEFQSLQGVIDAIGLEPCELCTYCWTGRE